jgi:predicted RNase H-like HicB family nuclease
MLNTIKTDGNDQVLELRLSVLVFQEGDYYVSYCPSLNLSSYGESIQEAKDGFDEVMRHFIDESVKHKTLRKDLLGNGWILHNHYKIEPPEQVELNIPGGSLKKQFNESWRVPATC